MRLTCPNCGARYEVADSMIPPEGRDVQCSNCSTTWFQPGRRTDRALDDTVDPSVPQETGPIAEDTADRPNAGDRAVMAEGEEPVSPPEGQRDAGQSAESSAAVAEAQDADEAVDAMPRRREMDPDVRDILREEAEREARLRRAEGSPVETQAEMPLDEEPDDLHRARRRAELENAEDAFAAVAGAPAARDLFPDIDEINSTLRDTGDRSSDEVDTSDIDTLDTAPRRRRGTRIGFLLAIAIAAAGAGLYGNADLIGTQVPALAPALDRYEGAVNTLRFWLDDLAQGLG